MLGKCLMYDTYNNLSTRLYSLFF
uniref:Uncharacterized protein n=1 Tax=Lepeophtheirus salmonis TaxID=72036 RepID=A0A0K2U479_LEPSM